MESRGQAGYSCRRAVGAASSPRWPGQWPPPPPGQGLSSRATLAPPAAAGTLSVTTTGAPAGGVAIGPATSAKARHQYTRTMSLMLAPLFARTARGKNAVRLPLGSGTFSPGEMIGRRHFFKLRYRTAFINKQAGDAVQHFFWEKTGNLNQGDHLQVQFS